MGRTRVVVPGRDLWVEGPHPGNNGRQWKQWQTLFGGGSKIIADGDCSHEIKRHLLLRRKAMTSLDSILKSRDITLPTKFDTVKAMFFFSVWM